MSEEILAKEKAERPIETAKVDAPIDISIK